MGTKRLKALNLPNNINNNQLSTCNIQVNPKLFNPPLQVGDILEISAASTQTNQNTYGVNSYSTSSNNQIQTMPNPSTPSSASSSSNAFNQNDPDGNSLNATSNPILLQITQQSLCENMPLDNVRLDGVAFTEPFNIKNYGPVNVTFVKKETVTLDLVELLFKEQYLNGSDMWRFKMQVQGKCVHLKKVIEFCGMRCTVREMWANGEIVTCGYISDTTRLVFRSQSAMCTIYIQMSKEMWEFDVNGEMYHEKAVNFLAELFTNWKNQTCQHDVTIALFSRVFYEAQSKTDFPTSITTCIKQDYKGRFHEDFYRIVHQNERYEDWMLTLVQLKRLIKEYRDYILHYHERQCSQPVPKCYLSSAAEGNFLETLNLSASVFERHYIDRPFDRTGMMSLIITAGCGVFEVYRELTKITKERVIDNGIGSDLVCLGEQPLHSVPLFKFAATETYSIPHWINLSFYKSSETVRYCNSNFRPCVKIKFKNRIDRNLNSKAVLPDYNSKQNIIPLEETDDIFQKPKPTDSLKRAPSRINTSQDLLSNSANTTNSGGSTAQIMSSSTIRHHSKRGINYDSDDERMGGASGVTGANSDSSFEFDSDPETMSTTSANTTNTGKKTINPFKPSTIKAKMSFERRRWAHLFPLRPDGTPIFQHHMTVNSNDSLTPNVQQPTQQPPPLELQPPKFNKMSLTKPKPSKDGVTTLQHTTSSRNMNPVNDELVHGDECIATMITGVAWKSLTIPACLPLTTDFSPNKAVWDKKFVCASNYSLLLDEIREQYGYSYVCSNTNTKITMKDVFPELVGHRLAMGFQMVIGKNSTYTLAEALSVSSSVTAKLKDSIKGYYKLSLGRIYHELFYINDTQNEYIKVEICVPRDKVQTQKIVYNYRFQVPDSKLYQVSFCDIYRKSIEDIKWNLIDCYICIQGNGSLSPLELQNCWRQRLYLMPLMYLPTSIANSNSNSTTTAPTTATSPAQYNLASFLIAQKLPGSFHFDVYQRKTTEELNSFRETYFLRFMEYLNKLSRADDRRILLSSIQPNSTTPGLKEKLPDPKESCEPFITDYKQYFKNNQTNEVNMLRKRIVYTLENDYKVHMLNKEYGIPFLNAKNDIPQNCFISAEATWWCMQNIANIDTEAQAIWFLQILIDFNIIQHISCNTQEKTYIHGFYLYYILTNESLSHSLYTKDYCEVGLCEFECGMFSQKILAFTKNLPAKMLPVLPNDYTFSKSIINTALESPILKLVNVDVDPNHRSDRVEWASAIYRSYHHPLCAFELEIYWKMATGQLLSDLINHWTKMANKYNYHIVPSPIDPFAMPLASPACSDPLRGPIYIQINLNCMLQDEFILFENYIERKYLKFNENNKTEDIIQHPEIHAFLVQKYKEDNLKDKLEQDHFLEMELQEFFERERIFRLQYFQEAVLERFGFIRNAAIAEHNSDEDPTFFIHSSGGMFVLIPNYYSNYTARSRHASAQATNNTQLITSSKPPLQQQNEFRTLYEENFKNLLENLDSTDCGNQKLNESLRSEANKETKSSSMQQKALNEVEIEIVDASQPTINKSMLPDGATRKNSQQTDTQKSHVNFNDDYPKRSSNSISSSSVNETISSRPKSNRERSSTKYLSQFYELNKETINKTIPDEKAKTNSHSDLNIHFFLNNTNCADEKSYDDVDGPNGTSAYTVGSRTDRRADSEKSVSSESSMCPVQTFMINNNVVKRKLPFYADSDLFIGFLWSWNFMLGKRWRSQYTGDELFQDSALLDFTGFCANKDARLQNFYNQSK